MGTRRRTPEGACVAVAATDPARRSTIARIAADARWNRQTPEVETLHREIKAERLALYIASTVDAAPALSSEQRDQLAALLRPAPAAGGDDRVSAA